MLFDYILGMWVSRRKSSVNASPKILHNSHKNIREDTGMGNEWILRG